ncbi:ATP-dependent helicase [Ruicaihuangia caeni]|uniref:ATP-dependent helicase n=1 Tax=Ruicaihuangia caeni TaxID=3042517 RepID=A0AAW6T8Z4_9MICO|nr:ATP-dependent helicase [Klugiella sp. YN-L-19]MDI2098513.1 ATP-dependent helicase [Klugiella sp. YN-L-19]
MTALDRFSPATAAWFAGAFEAPTDAQAGAWESISTGAHSLVIAPTGSGKTLAAFLWSLDRLMVDQRDLDPKQRTRVLYISPLKALGVDVERNLRAPLIGITQTARRLGQPAPEPTVGVRSGDTPPQERRALQRTPPDILITTPESLYLMLTSSARESLRNVETVIIDEVHAVAGTKRGAHLALSLERLDLLLERPAQRIGLSATVRPPEEVARFLGGAAPVQIVAPPSGKRFDLRVVVPVEDMTELGGTGADGERSGSIWPHVEAELLERVLEHRSTIVFANSRRIAERLTGRINELYEERLAEATAAELPPEPPPLRDEADDGARDAVNALRPQGAFTSMPAQLMGQSGQVSGAEPVLARAHHGSVSKEQRGVIEDDLKSGRLRCVVATSSLELGIDMGAVDQVIQVESPPSVASGLQRIGRAGHQVGGISKGIIVPQYRGDLVPAAVTSERMAAGAIEQLVVPSNPLDVLAQQTVAAVALEPLEVETWFDTVRRSAPFSALPRSAFDATLDLLAGRYPSDEFAQLRPRVVWDRVHGTLTGRPGAQRLAVTSGGTIPDRGMFGVFMVGDATGGTRVGELDEEMVYESRVGDVFALGTTSWRIEEITHDRVVVSPAFGQAARVPFWRGDRPGRPLELGRALGAFMREIASSPGSAAERLRGAGLDERAIANLTAYLREQQDATGHVPSDRVLVVERFRDELGDWRLVLHSPFGLDVHAPWALAVSARVRERYGIDAAANASDDGMVVRLQETDAEPPGAELFVFEADELDQLVTDEVGGSALFASRFRECAARALLLPKLDPGRRSPLWQQRQKASQLLAVASKYPAFPIVLETMREVLQDVYDLPGLISLMKDLSSRKVRLVETATEQPSPFARSLLFGYVGQFIYEGDSPLAERRAAALALDTTLLAELLGRAELRELLDPAVIRDVGQELQRLTRDRLAADAEALADLLRLLGPLTAEEIAERVEPGSTPLGWLDELERANRVIRARIAGVEHWAVVEDAARLRDALGVPLPIGVPTAFLEPVADPVGDLVSRYARTHAPFTIADVASRFGLGTAVAHDALRRLAADRRVLEGEFTPDAIGTEWVDAEVLRRLRARSLAALRREVEPVPPDTLARFLPMWQHVGGRLRGVDGVLQVVEQLAGVPLPASAWESLVLPSRVSDYEPGMLDELTTSGEVVWAGHGALPGHDGWVSLHTAESSPLTLPLVSTGVGTARKATGGGTTDGASIDGAAIDGGMTDGGTTDGGMTGGGTTDKAAIDVDSRTDAAGESSGGVDDALGELELAIMAALAGGGGYFFRQLSDAVGAGRGVVDDADLATALWNLVWAGAVTNDSFAPLRSSSGVRRTPRPRSYRGRGRAALPSRSGPPTVAGRWSVVPTAHDDPTMRAAAAAEQLLERYGVVTRGFVQSEELPGGFALVYKVLKRFEESGRARRGYFVEGLGAAQFATGPTVDRLRSFNRDDAADADRPPTAIALAATDPANAYGSALPWPEVEGHRPARKAGAIVVLVDGALAVYLERGGKSALTFGHAASEQGLEAAASALAGAVRRGARSLRIERVNGEFAIGTAFGLALERAGFAPTPQGLRLRV